MPDHFGERLREARKRRKLTMEQLGSMVGVAKSTVSGYENGNREPPLSIVYKLATSLHTSSDYLLGLMKDQEMPVPSRDSGSAAQISPHSIYWNGIELEEEDIQSIRLFMEKIVHQRIQQKNKLDELA